VRGRDAAIVAALVVAAVALRMPGLFAGIWRDEGSTYFDAAAPSLAAALHEIRTAEINPPGYFLLMRAWLAIAGTSDVTMKLPSLLFGVGLVPATYLLGRIAASRAVGCIAAALAAFSSVGIDLSTDARPYACAAFLAALAVAAALRAVRDGAPAWRALVAYAVAAIACEYVQYTGLLLAFGLTCAALIDGVFARRAAPALRFAGANLLVALALVPWLPALFGPGAVAAAWLQPIGPGELPGRIVEQFGFVLPFDFMRAQYAIALLIAFAVAAARRRAGGPTIVCGIALILALAVEAFALLRDARYAFAFTPAANVLVAVALVAAYAACARFARNPAQRPQAFGAPLLGGLIGLSLLAGIPAQARAYARVVGTPERSGMRAFARWYGPPRTDTLAVVAPDYLGPSLGYYWRAGPDVRLVGVPHASHPEHFRCCEGAWRDPALVADAARAIAREAAGKARIAFVYDPGAVDRGAVPYSKTLALRARLARSFPTIAERRFDGTLEPVAVTIFDAPLALVGKARRAGSAGATRRQQCTAPEVEISCASPLPPLCSLSPRLCPPPRNPPHPAVCRPWPSTIAR
jgi:hypothetical protein